MTAEPVHTSGNSHLRLHAKAYRRFGWVIAIAAALIFAVGSFYFAGVKWGVRHEMLSLYDASRGRQVDLDIAVRRDIEVQADAGLFKMPVAVINHGNTVRFTEYSFLSNFFAARGYLAISIQHDLASDKPLVTEEGEPYVGRLPVYERGVANILFALDQVKKRDPGGDYSRVTLVGHSNGGDISMYFAKTHPDMVAKVVTLDNLRVPLQGAFKILSFRSKDPQFVPDPGVVPGEETCKKGGITVVNTKYRHTDMSDRGPEGMKTSIEDELAKFLKDDKSDLAPVQTDQIDIPEP